VKIYDMYELIKGSGAASYLPLRKCFVDLFI